MNILGKIKSFIKWAGSTDLSKATLLSLLIIFLTAVVAIFTLTEMYKMSARLYQPLDEANQIKQSFLKSDSLTTTIAPDKVKFLRMEYSVLEKFKYHHKEVGRVYYSNYYSFTVVLSLSIVITAMLVFLISSKGWVNANLILKVAFGTFFCISSFFGIMMATLGQKNNYEDNFKQYLYFDKIQNNIITFLKTSDQYEKQRAQNLVDSFIVAINNDLRTNSQFFLTIDANKASLEDISSKLGKATNGK